MENENNVEFSDNQLNGIILALPKCFMDCNCFSFKQPGPWAITCFFV